MTPEQNKHTEQAAQKFYETEYNNLPGRSGNRIIGTFIAGVEYAFSHLSPGGWVRASERLPDFDKAVCLKWKGEYTSGLFQKHYNKNECYMHNRGTYPEAAFINIEWYDETLSPSDKDKDELRQEIKSLDATFDYLYHTEGVKDAGHRWIAFSDKWEAFKRKYFSEALNTKEVNGDD